VATNWSLGRAPLAGDDVQIATTSNMTQTNDLAADISFASLTFNAGTGAATIGGNRITLAGNLVNLSSNLQTLNIAIILPAGAHTVQCSSDIQLNAVLSSTGSISKTGAGTLWMGVDDSGVVNTFSGGISISAGTVYGSVRNNSIFGTGDITIGTGTSNLFLNRQVIANNLVNNGGTLSLTNGFGCTVSGTITNNALLNLYMEQNSLNTISGAISGVGGITVTSDFTSVRATLSGNNTFSGTLTITDGTIKAGSTTAFGTNAAVVMANNADAILDTTGFNNSIGSLAGGGGTGGNVSLGGATLTIGGNGTNTSYSGVISGTGAVTKTGAGTLTYLEQQMYAGATTINDGIVSLGNGGVDGALNSASAITVTSPGNLTFNHSDTLTQVSDFKNLISGTGSVTQAGSGNLIFTGLNSYSGGTFVTNGTLTLDVTGHSNPQPVIAADSNLTITNGTVNLIGDVANTLYNTTAGTVTINAGGILSANGTSAANNTNNLFALVMNGGTLAGGTATTNVFRHFTFNSDISVTETSTISATTSLANFAIDVSTSKTLTMSGEIRNKNAIVTNINKTGAGTLVLSGANIFTGKTNINAGTLSAASLNNVSGGGASSNLGAPVTVANGTIAIGNGATGGTLVYTGTGETTDRVIDLAGTTGGATITQSGASGLLKFSQPATATGAGIKLLTLQGSAAGTGEIAAAIVDNSGTNKTSVTKDGSGVWTLSGTNTYTGATTVTNGTLLANGTINAGSAVAVSTGATLGGNGTIGGAITAASGSFVKPGAATGVSIGQLTTAAVTLQAGSIYSVDLNGTTPTFDKINASGTITLAGTLSIASIANAATGKVYTIAESATGVTGTFVGMPNDSAIPVSGRLLKITYTATTAVLTDIGSGTASSSLLAVSPKLRH
jgi:autotransporter-associated beta strand protein